MFAETPVAVVRLEVEPVEKGLHGNFYAQGALLWFIPVVPASTEEMKCTVPM